MFARVSQTLQSYLTRRVTAWLTLLAAAVLLLLLWAASLTAEKIDAAAVWASNLIALPTMGAAFLLAHHAKWQFVHPRARLMPHYASAHGGVLGALTLLALAVYPLIAAGLLGAPALGVCSFAALSGALFTWSMHTQRAVFTLPALAAFFSAALPHLNGVWFAPGPEYLSFRVAALIAGWAGLGLWLWRLVTMTEEDEDYLIPVSAQTGRLSRMEKSEARRHAARMVTRAWLSGWIADRWHNRLAGVRAADDRQRRRLLRYGLAPSPAWTRIAFFMILMAGIVGLQAVMLSGARFDNRGAMIVGQVVIFALIGPSILGQLLAARGARLSQELLFPMTRRSLVDGLMSAVASEAVGLMATVIIVAAAGAAAVAADQLTPRNTIAVLAALACLLPSLVAVALLMGLIESGMKRVLVMLLSLYAAAGVGAGCVAVSVLVGLPYGLALCAVVAVLGALLVQHARRRWMSAEFG